MNFNQIMYDVNAYRAELLDITAQVSTPNNLIEQLAKEEGHEVLYLPQYHPELNAIEMEWAHIKSIAAYGPTYNLQRLKNEILPNCFHAVTPDRASSLFEHVDKVIITLKQQYELIGDTVSLKEDDDDEYECDFGEDDNVNNQVYYDEEDDEFIDEDEYEDGG